MSYLCLHMQAPVPNWPQRLAQAYAAGSPYIGLKAFQVERYGEAQAASPGIHFVFRHWIDNQDPYIWADNHDQAADAFLDHFADSLLHHIGANPETEVYIESLNEEYPTNNLRKLRKAVAFDRAFIRAVRRRLPGFRPLVFTAAIGNPGHDEYGELVHLARDTQAAGGAFGYHAYHSVYHGRSFVRSKEHAHNLHMRWDVIDTFLRRRGIRVNWFLGEVGATSSRVDGYIPSNWAGWRHSTCWSGDEVKYLQDLAALDALLAATDAAQTGRLKGAAIFTTNPRPRDWTYYRVSGSMLDRLTNYVAGSSPPVGGPPPPRPEPPPPPPGPEPATATLQRYFNVRTRPSLSGVRIATGRPGTTFESEGVVEGEEWHGDRRWRKLTVYIHEQGFES